MDRFSSQSSPGADSKYSTNQVAGRATGPEEAGNLADTQPFQHVLLSYTTGVIFSFD